MHRSEYMSADRSDPSVVQELHRAYYAQYVTPPVLYLVAQVIGERTIRASECPHFNDIPLRRWVALVSCSPSSIVPLLGSNGDWLSLGIGVCILKEAAQQIRETPLK